MSKRLRRRLLLAGALAVAVWVTLFDSHSLLRRATYAHDLDRLTEENAALAADNEALASQIRRGLDPETVEKVAREQYGMRRPGDRVYRIEATEAD